MRTQTSVTGPRLTPATVETHYARPVPPATVTALLLLGMFGADPAWTVAEWTVAGRRVQAEVLYVPRPSHCVAARGHTSDRRIAAGVRQHVERERTATMADTQQATTRTTRTASQTFSAAERAAMRERAKELKAAQSKADDARDCLAKIAEMQGPDRMMAERLHALITATAPALAPKTWYGMPAYARDGQIVCFFKSAHKYNQRYATLGFSDKAQLDEGTMWPTDFALTALSAADEERIVALVWRAVR